MEPTAVRILVTGGSGFMGTNLIAQLQGTHGVLMNLDTQRPRAEAQLSFWRKADLRDADAVRGLVRDFRPTHVYHLGARTDLHGQRLEDYAANHEGTVTLLEALKTVGSTQRILIASTRLVTPTGYIPTDPLDYHPHTVYGQSKVEMEKRVRDLDVPFSWAIVRPTSIWGPWFDHYRVFFLAVAKGRYFHPTREPLLKSFGYVGNATHQLLRLMEAPRERVQGRTLYLADYQPLEVFAWAGLIREATHGPPVRHVPLWMLRVAARFGDLAKHLGWRDPPLASYRLHNLITPMVYDLSELQAIVGPLPYSLELGVRETVGWLRQEGLL